METPTETAPFPHSAFTGEQPALIPTPPNEPITTASPALEAPLGQKIIGAANSAFSAIASTIKKGRGRPRNDGSPKISDKIAPLEKAIPENPGKAPVVDSPVVNKADVLLFRRSITAAVKGVFGLLKSILRTKADAAGIEKEFTETALKSADADKETQDGFNEALELVLEKHKLETEYAPEIALLIYGIRIAAPYGLLLKTFDAEIKRKREQERTDAIKKPV